MNAESLRSLAQANKQAAARQEQTHTALVDAIWEAADQGMPQVEIVAAVGLTRERVRQLCDPRYRERAQERRTRHAVVQHWVTKIVLPASRSVPRHGPETRTRR